MVGEFIRNCCVNLCIDPDTVDGRTRNVNVYLDDEGDAVWDYDPNQILKDSRVAVLQRLRIEFLDGARTES